MDGEYGENVNLDTITISEVTCYWSRLEFGGN
jgi:hypothetical protein